MIQRMFSSLLDAVLPKKTKRQLFLVSFAALLKGATSYDQETFRKLNRVLALSESNDRAMGAGVILSQVIWHGKNSFEVCKENIMEGSFASDRISRIVTNILNVIPKCLVYGEQDEIEQDLTVILENRMNLFGA